MTIGNLDITYYPKKTVHIFGFILCSLATITAVTIGIIEGWPWFAYPFVGVFMLMALVAVVQLLPGCKYLHLNAEGFTICSLFRTTSIPWSAVKEFLVIRIHPGTVGLNFVSSYENPLGANKMFSKLINCDFALPDQYGMNPEELAAFMNECLIAANPTETNP